MSHIISQLQIEIMLQGQSGDLINQQQMKQYLKSDQKAATKKEEKLKKWIIYWKRRGKNTHQVQQDYSKDIQQVGSFSSIKSFFSFYTSIKQPSSLDIDTKIFYFLQNCNPVWEQWLHSGMLLIKIKFKDQKDQIGAAILNKTWQFLLFSLVGNNLPLPRLSKSHLKCQKTGSEPIIGLILQRRDKISLIQVWYRNELHSNQLTRMIQQDLSQHLKLKNQQQKSLIEIKYKRHKDSIQTNSTIKGGIKLRTTIGTVSMYL